MRSQVQSQFTRYKLAFCYWYAAVGLDVWLLEWSGTWVNLYRYIRSASLVVVAFTVHRSLLNGDLFREKFVSRRSWYLANDLFSAGSHHPATRAHFDARPGGPGQSGRRAVVGTQLDAGLMTSFPSAASFCFCHWLVCPSVIRS